MRIERADPEAVEGRYAGPWNSGLTVSVGYAREGIDNPHVHRETMEVYLVARGESMVHVERETIALAVGDMLVVEPGEAHTFLVSSADYVHFVVHVPGLPAGRASADHLPAPRSRLGLDGGER